jgi:hypothetical protein
VCVYHHMWVKLTARSVRLTTAKHSTAFGVEPSSVLCPRILHGRALPIPLTAVAKSLPKSQACLQCQPRISAALRDFVYQLSRF